MSWWNPLDWAADAVADAARRELEKLWGHIKDNPEIVAVPAAIGAGIVGTVFTLKSYGDSLGPYLAHETIQLLEE